MARNELNSTPDPSRPQGIYVPKDLDDCFTELKKMLHPDLLKEIKESSGDDLSTCHFGLGVWMKMVRYDGDRRLLIMQHFSPLKTRYHQYHH